ncbi:ArnT family glycosyltransferase [Hymenobacter elongatus]|nr:glycosyltransferase family 39 protein [Hymenobacter elongatus]
MPPIGPHTWRQCNTLAVARNFYEEDMNILRPRIDRRNDSDGVTGMQFPSYEWSVAVAYQVFGFHETLPRIISWLISVAGLFFGYCLIRRITGSVWMGAVAAWGLAWSPEIYYHSINALPDVLASSASLGGLWYFLRWREHRRAGHFWLSLVLTALAGLTKLQFLLIGFPIAVLLLQDIQRRQLGWRRDAGPLAFFALASVGIPLAWYAYARNLIEVSGLRNSSGVVCLCPQPDRGFRAAGFRD